MMIEEWFDAKSFWIGVGIGMALIIMAALASGCTPPHRNIAIGTPHGTIRYVPIVPIRGTYQPTGT